MRILSVLFFFLLVISCSENSEPDDLAGKAAKAYYDDLVGGKYNEFVSGIADADYLPQSYRNQLAISAKQFLAHQKELHNSIEDIKVINTKLDTIDKIANVWLLLCYGDSTSEEVLVPMVEYNGQWKMK